MYHAPIRELRFVLHELLGDERLSSLSGLTDYSADFADSVLEEAGKFAEEVLAPINRVGDMAGAKWTPDGVTMPREFKGAYGKFAEGGWSQLRGSQEYGGQGAPIVLGTAVEELWASSNLAFKLCPMLTQGAIEAIQHVGTEKQKRTYLPKMISGEWTGTMNLTETQAGSDLAAIRTRATPDGGRFRVFGQKIFITYGDHDYTANVIHLVLARIDGSPPGTKGLSLFIVPKFLVNDDDSLGARNDVRCVSIEHKLGIHASPTCVLAYGDKEGAIGYLIGEANRGLEYMFIMMNAARLSVGLEGYALGERAYQQALEWSRNRVQGKPATQLPSTDGKPRPIAYHADVKRMLLTMKAYTDAARAIALYAALQLDIARHSADSEVRSTAQARGELLIPIVKAFSTETGIAMTSLGVQVHGGMGFIEETGAAQFSRDVRIAAIYEGTTGIQASDLIGRKVARDGGAAMTSLLADMQAELALLPNNDPGSMCAKNAALEAVASLRDATTSVLQSYRQSAELAFAVAVPYLMLSGLAIGGWLMAKSRAIAAQKSATEPDFYRGKQQIARCYLEHVLPETLALSRVVSNGMASIAEADPNLF
jgi:acyl-CoA dehydrogenase